MRTRLAIAALLALCLGLAPVPPRASDARRDADTPAANAVGFFGGCTATLIAPDLALTVAHCVNRVLRGPGRDTKLCPRLWGQARLAGHPDHAPYRWHKAGPGTALRLGPDMALPDRPSYRIDAIAFPRCADMALLRLSRPVPADQARPIPVITRAASDSALEMALTAGPLRHAGYGRPDAQPPSQSRRATGRAAYWNRNACNLFALPPLRSHGRRIAGGDSGAPLLLRLPDGGEAVVAVLWGRSVPDIFACGLPATLPPEDHGTYTPTFRGPIPDTQATDLAHWLEVMAPEAVMALP